MPRNFLATLRELMKLEFAVLELNLYLNTHPRDEKALEDYNYYVNQLEKAKQRYRQRYGPLTAECPSDYPWQYPEGPWPWEIKY